MAEISRPVEGEYHPYYQRYVEAVPGGDLAEVLRRQLARTTSLLEHVSPEQAAHRYAPGKWSVREVVGHMTDTERIMAYRLLRIARGDATPLPGFDENAYVALAGFDECALGDLVEAFEATRAATLALLGSLSDEAARRVGIANGTPTSARALAYIIAGHERHHTDILRERYGLG